MIFNALIKALTPRKLVDKQLLPIPLKPESNEFTFRSKYQQRRISNRIFK